MRIETKQERALTTFIDIRIGECFVDKDGDVLIKIDGLEVKSGDVINSVMLSNGCPVSFADWEDVSRVNITAVIE